jgi:tRNA(Ile)-lysidine synthase
MAATRGLPFILERVDVSTYAEEHGLSIEEAARTQRYRFLFQAAAAQEAQAVAVGHNADDQVETVIMHLLRGAGLDGLKGMTSRGLPNAWSKTIPLVRPLLGIWREEIIAYLVSNQLTPVEDASNVDTRFYRNRLRHDLIPYLEGYNPGIRKRTWQMADLLAEDYALLEDITEKAWEASLLERGRGYLALDQATLSAQPLGIQRRLVRRAIAALRPGLRDIDFAAVARALDFSATPSASGQIDLIAGLRLRVESQRLWLAAWEADLPDSEWPQISPEVEITVEVPGMTQLNSDWILQSELVEDAETGRKQAMGNNDPNQVWLDLDAIQTPLYLRARRPGDRLAPLGMGGKSMKISEFMVNVKLPQRARGGWPLVFCAEGLVWAAGLQLAHPFRIRPKTTRLLHLSLDCQGPK